MNNTIQLNSEPLFDVRYGYRVENGEYEFDKAFDVPLSKIQFQLRYDESCIDDLIGSDEEFQFIDAVYKLNSEEKVNHSDLLEILLTQTDKTFTLTSKNDEMLKFLSEKFK